MTGTGRLWDWSAEGWEPHAVADADSQSTMPVDGEHSECNAERILAATLSPHATGVHVTHQVTTRSSNAR